ncbi:glycosyltransferase [Microbacterium sp. XT11]|uniref:glycosyltransferase n=1 Tax=Microbacterium sp. XT11 TaxID=367477 RepID=UPI0008306293|nr:glycosyltransferase [Microbacterium sp. XT11]
MSTCVLLPTASTGEWLDLAVRSVLESDSTTRVLVVFDGVPPTLDRWWVKDERVSYLERTTSQGLAAALNAGLAAIDAEFVARLDADDVALRGRFLKQEEFLRSHPEFGAVSGSAILIDEAGMPLGHLDASAGSAADIRRSLLQRNRLIHPAVMYRRSVVVSAGGYDESLRYMEDYELWLRLSLETSIAATSEPVIKYRLHASQMTKAAPAHGQHVRKVLHGRRRLARSLGVSPIWVESLNAAWVANQFLRVLRARLRAKSLKK